jgi:hypothetical protein
MPHPILLLFFSLSMLALINLGEEWASGKLFRKKRKKALRRPEREGSGDFDPDLRDWR